MASASNDNPGAPAADVSPLEAAAREALSMVGPGADTAPLLWDRARRLVRLVGLLAVQPEMANRRHDRHAAEAAALFFEVARARALSEGRLAPDDALDGFLDQPAREASIDSLRAAAPGRLSDETRDAAATAIRQHAWRAGASAEAMLLAEAVNLDDLGPLWLLRRAASGVGTHQTIAAVATQWQRQNEYGYWETRINDLLRFGWSRQVARRRVAAVQVFLESLQEQIGF